MTTREQPPVSGADSSVAQLVERMSAQITALVRDEMALATAEMRRKSTQVGVGIGIGGAGGVLALLGLGSLTAAAVLGLANVLAPWLAALIVGLVLIVLAGVLALAGIGQVRSATPPVPEQAMQSTKQDIKTVKESIHR
ncbi:MAG TPA: phage holin family protein [Pseudonocardiaceae bacterium]|jgi:membrane protein|nr:phage holin family protein [Pseudonocardiaceae bacterium]